MTPEYSTGSPTCCNLLPPPSLEASRYGALEAVEYLSDVSRLDRAGRWDRRRELAEEVAERLAGAPDEAIQRQAARMDACSRCLTLRREWEPSDEGPGVEREVYYLHEVQFCRGRFCALCAWRRAQVWRRRVFEALPRVEQEHPGARWVFLTLTVRNVPVEELRAELGRCHQAFTRMTRRVARGRAWPGLGWVRTTEVTLGKDGRAHPHLHVLVLVPGEYFEGLGYLDHAAWMELWRSCARLDYDPSVRVNAVEPRRKGIRSAVVEVLKYGVKPGDYRRASDAWLWELVRQLQGFRAVGVGGVLRDYLREEEPDADEMMLQGDQEQAEEDEAPDLVRFWWRGDSARSPRYARRLRLPRGPDERGPPAGGRGPPLSFG